MPLHTRTALQCYEQGQTSCSVYIFHCGWYYYVLVTMQMCVMWRESGVSLCTMCGAGCEQVPRDEADSLPGRARPTNYLVQQCCWHLKSCHQHPRCCRPSPPRCHQSQDQGRHSVFLFAWRIYRTESHNGQHLLIYYDRVCSAPISVCLVYNLHPINLL